MRSRALDTRPSTTRRRMRAALSTTATLAVTAGLALSGSGAAHAAPVTIDIVTINDFHGRLEATQLTAGAAVLAGAVDSVRAANPGNVAMVSAGDNIGASTFTSFIQQDEPTIDALNAMGLDASAAGNHEFDRGYDDLLGRVTDSADFPILSANVDGPTGGPELAEFHVEEIGGIRVGFIGAVTEELLTLVSPAGMTGVTVDPIVESVNRVAAALSDGDPANDEADVVIAVTHEGAPTSSSTVPLDIPQDSVFGRIVAGLDGNVDAIFSGHTHQRYAGTASFDEFQRPIIQTGQYSEAFGRLTLTVDSVTKEITAASPVVTPLVTRTGAGTRTDPYVYTPNFAADPEVAEIVSDAAEVAAVEGSRPLGGITADFTRANQATAIDGSTENRGGESTLGNFVADVQVWSTSELDTEVAFMNPGGLRADLTFADRSPSIPGDAQGRVTYREAAEVQPFANTLVTMTLTGAQIRQVLEQQWQPSTASRPFLKLGISSALTYTYDPTAATGAHIREVRLNGAPLADGTAVKVVVNSFLAAGGDNFGAFASGTSRADSGRVDLEGMVDYFAAQNGTPVAPDLGQRAVGANLAAPADPAGYRAGETTTLTLSSLLFSGPEAKPSTAEARIAGTLIGSGPIDPAIVSTTDEVGRAAFTVTIPAGAAPGSYDVVVTTPGAPTTATVPIVVAAAPVTPIDPGTQPGGTTPGGTAPGGTNGGDGAASAPSSGGSSSDRIATTGFDSAALLLPAGIAGAALILGAVLMITTARRRRAARS